MSDLQQTVKYLLSINSVRDRSTKVFQKVLANDLTNFDVDLSKVDGMVNYILNLIHRDYGTNYDSIPPHGRWQHFDAGGVKRVDALVSEWTFAGIDKLEIGRRLVDLFVISVLLDAGAGNIWKFIEPGSGSVIVRSEGLAVASLYMFKQGLFGTDNKQQVNAAQLLKFSQEQLAQGMQVSKSNELAGLDGRSQILGSLGKSLAENPEIFGQDGRPGGLVDYLLSKSKDNQVDLTVLWDALMTGLISIWPAGRTKLGGVALGDAWVVSDLATETGPGANIVPFHKLTQWLCYSIIVPIKQFSGLEILNESLQTGLPEYRNGGLLVDFGVLSLKGKQANTNKGSDGIPTFQVFDDVIIEWRAATVGFLDYILTKVNSKLEGGKLTLPQLLEAGTWKAGREIAAEKRPDTKGPPIGIISDGTVF